MDTETFIKNYIEIETQIFDRAYKSRRLDEFIANLKSSNFQLNLAETLNCINILQKEKITIRQPLFSNVFYPVLVAAIDQDNIDAIKSLISLQDFYDNFQRILNDNNFSIWKLLDKGLSLSPNDSDLLNLYEMKQREFFEYTLHELPAGVLYVTAAATLEECEELLSQLKRYKEVCQKLSIDKEEFISECKYYFAAYKSYLPFYKSYNGFGDYLSSVEPKD